MGGACRTYGRDEKYTKNFGQKTEGKIPLRNMDTDWRMILNGS